MTKTNALRLLDAAKIPHRAKEYTPDENHLLGADAMRTVGMTADEIFKTLVTRGDKTGIQVFCVPINYELDLKKCASVSGNKKIEMIHVKELLPLTGYIRGACSPIGMKKKYPTYLDETAILFDEIGVSGGAHGLEICINAQVLCDFVGGTLCDLTK